MFRTKDQRITDYDVNLCSLERAADRIGYDLDNDPQWKELNQMITDYQVGEIRHSPQFRNKFFAIRREICKCMGY